MRRNKQHTQELLAQVFKPGLSDSRVAVRVPIASIMAGVHYFAGRGRAEQARWMLAATETPFQNRVLPVMIVYNSNESAAMYDVDSHTVRNAPNDPMPGARTKSSARCATAASCCSGSCRSSC